MCKNENIRKAVAESMQEIGAKNNLSSLEKPKQFVLHHDPFTPENNILTSTSKLKRNVAKQVFQAQIDEMYAKITAAEQARG